VLRCDLLEFTYSFLKSAAARRNLHIKHFSVNTLCKRNILPVVGSNSNVFRKPKSGKSTPPSRGSRFTFNLPHFLLCVCVQDRCRFSKHLLLLHVPPSTSCVLRLLLQPAQSVCERERERTNERRMNSFLIAIVSIVFSAQIKSGIAATCSFCPGIPLDESFEIPDSGGATCGLVFTTAAMFEEGTDDCSGLQILERYCCPSGNEGSSCTFCEGVDELGYTIISQGVTCRDAAQIATMMSGDSVECTNFKMLETVCCPSLVTPPVSPCSFCTGLDVLENVSYEGTSCPTAVTIAGALESTSEQCYRAQAYQSICCPRTPTAACSFCVGATTMASGPVVQDTLTCTEVADYAAWLESTAEECSIAQQAEAMCCPDATTYSPISTPNASPTTPTPPESSSNAPSDFILMTSQPSLHAPSPTTPTPPNPTSNVPTNGQSTPLVLMKPSRYVFIFDINGFLVLCNLF
jgi:hypothetical protein